eukprot:CAMPEP_0194509706 /NCGR_PEP_ID=MMETSP0253-20130528/40702_1 /TAXON_ID=2966 /ORGANISM="Noctiluca scintillans" /LENGTH=69 /DNA_ID=CAMNT_0039352887 /DNA_START=145 /DNA_END=350 /DNA_ORIENTATION=+
MTARWIWWTALSSATATSKAWLESAPRHGGSACCHTAPAWHLVAPTAHPHVRLACATQRSSGQASLAGG